MSAPQASTIDPILQVRSRVALLAQENIDTDQIIPARFLTTTERAGLGRHCFADWRYDAQGHEREDFALNGAEARGAGILLAGRNFGCGSSREHAPWALLDYGIRVVISTQIADIFRNNALKNGLLPIVVDEQAWQQISEQVGNEISVDLEAQHIVLGSDAVIPFAVEAFARQCLMRGVDQLGYLLQLDAQISRFENKSEAA